VEGVSRSVARAGCGDGGLVAEGGESVLCFGDFGGEGRVLMCL
jgi:hypothetical protein